MCGSNQEIARFQLLLVFGADARQKAAAASQVSSITKKSAL